MIKKLSAALVYLATATAGHALTSVATPGAPDPFVAGGSEAILVDFNSAALPAGYTLTGGFAYATTTSDTAAAPASDTTQYLYISSALSPNTATLTTAFDLSSISFYWGSIDTFNSVDVLGTGGVVLGSYSGDMFPPATGDRTTAQTNQRISFTAGTGELITGLRFTSTGVAFEIDDIAGTAAFDGNPNGIVPEPASWMLLIAGFGLVGAAARRRRNGTAVVAA